MNSSRSLPLGFPSNALSSASAAIESGLGTGTIPAFFEHVCLHAPNAIALVTDSEQVTYTSLNIRANRLARLLLQSDVKPGDVVAVEIPRGISFVVSMLAILKIGAAYIPLALSDPALRGDVILADSCAKHLLTLKSIAAVRQRTNIATILIDSGEAVNDVEKTVELDIAPAHCFGSSPSESTACLMYRSDATAGPIGAVISHRNIISCATGLVPPLAIEPQDTVLQMSDPTSHMSLIEIWGGLLCGATLAIYCEDELEPNDAIAFLARNRVTWAAFCGEYLRYCNPDDLSRLRMLLVADDEHRGHTDALFRPPGPNYALAIVYGLIETTSYSFAFTCRGLEVSSASSPNTIAYVLDAALNPVQNGTAGELYIESPCLARGYLKRPGLTATRFIANAFGPSGSRLYRTGDLAIMGSNGDVKIVGHIDKQIYLRGLRFDMGETENALRSHPDVGNAAICVSEDFMHDLQLLAYVTPANLQLPQGQTGLGRRLRDYLRRRLPRPLIPLSVTVIDEMPVTPSGDVDREALPPAVAMPTADYRPPSTELEARLCDLIGEVLGISTVGTDDDFFELGGHSLAAVRLAMHVADAFQIDLPVRAVFESRTAANIAGNVLAVSAI